MSRSEKTTTIMKHVDEDEKHTTSLCPWHKDQCFFLVNNDTQKIYHCLFEYKSKRWTPYGPTNRSCDIPEHFHDLILLRHALGPRYVLPFDSHFRERSGYTIGLYRLQPRQYSARILRWSGLAESFYALVVILCAACRRMGGSPPVLKRMSFVYTETHPVLVNVGRENAEIRERVGTLRCSNRKKWRRFMKKKSTIEVARYLKLMHPQFFKKKRRASSTCVLSEEHPFDDDAHRLVCRRKTLAAAMADHQHLMPDLRLRVVVRDWLAELEICDDGVRVEVQGGC